MSIHSVLHHEAQLKPRPLPWNPRKMMMKAAIEFLQVFKSISCRGQCNTPVGMKMVHMTKRKKSMQGRVNGSSHVVLAEGAERIKIRHFVFVGNATIAALEVSKLVEEESGKASALDASEVAAAPLFPPKCRGSAADGIGFDDFRTGISAAEICYTQIGTQKIRSIAKQFRLVKFRGQLRIPEIFEVAQFGQHGPGRLLELLQVENAISAAIRFQRNKA